MADDRNTQSRVVAFLAVFAGLVYVTYRIGWEYWERNRREREEEAKRKKNDRKEQDDDKNGDKSKTQAKGVSESLDASTSQSWIKLEKPLEDSSYEVVEPGNSESTYGNQHTVNATGSWVPVPVKLIDGDDQWQPSQDNRQQNSNHGTNSQVGWIQSTIPLDVISGDSVTSMSHHISTGDQLVPSTAHHIPTSAHNVPTAAHHVPTTTHHVPTTAHHVPTTSHQTSATSHHVPTTAHHLPATDHHVPATGHHVATTAHHVPTTAHHVPTTAHHVPTTAHHVPTTAHHVSTTAHHVPTAADHVPTTTHHVPAAHHVPTPAHHVPTTDHHVPTTTHQVPNNVASGDHQVSATGHHVLSSAQHFPNIGHGVENSHSTTAHHILESQQTIPMDVLGLGVDLSSGDSIGHTVSTGHHLTEPEHHVNASSSHHIQPSNGHHVVQANQNALARSVLADQNQTVDLDYDMAPANNGESEQQSQSQVQSEDIFNPVKSEPCEPPEKLVMAPLNSRSSPLKPLMEPEGYVSYSQDEIQKAIDDLIKKRSVSEVKVVENPSKSDHTQDSVGSEYQKKADLDLSEADISSMFDAIERSNLTRKHAELLVKLLATRDDDMLKKLLFTISKLAAFTPNQNLLREAGIIDKLSSILLSQKLAQSGGFSGSQPVIKEASNTIMNLAANEDNQKLMKDCVTSLIDIAQSASNAEDVQLSSLQALTNLSVMSLHHNQYTQFIHRLYAIVDSGSPTLCLQSLKVLANLSANEEMVPHLLAAKAPSYFLMLLDLSTSEDIILRWTTVLANICSTVSARNITASSLPVCDKAPSPETLHQALYGMNRTQQLRTKLFVLNKNTKNEDIQLQLKRIFSCWPTCSNSSKHSDV